MTGATTTPFSGHLFSSPLRAPLACHSPVVLKVVLTSLEYLAARASASPVSKTTTVRERYRHYFLCLRALPPVEAEVLRCPKPIRASQGDQPGFHPILRAGKPESLLVRGSAARETGGPPDGIGGLITVRGSPAVSSPAVGPPGDNH